MVRVEDGFEGKMDRNMGHISLIWDVGRKDAQDTQHGRLGAAYLPRSIKLIYTFLTIIPQIAAAYGISFSILSCHIENIRFG